MASSATDDDADPGPHGWGLLMWRGTEWARRSLTRFADARGSRGSAAIAYYVLLSLFPFMLLMASIAGLVLSDPETRQDFVEAVTDILPLSESGADGLESALQGVSDNAGTVGLVSLVALLWSASGMMGAIRGSLDDIDPDIEPRPFARGKAVDLLMVVIAVVLLAASAGLTVATRLRSGDAQDLVGVGGALYEAARVVVPIVLGTAMLVVVLRWVPTRGPGIRDLWPACVVGAVLLWALSIGFAAFIEHFGRYNVIYGSLAAVVVFLIYVYLAANLVLLTAAFAAEWRGIRTGKPGNEPGPGLGEEVWRFIRGLFVRDEGPPPPRPPRPPRDSPY
ncbi:MAG: YihY/virulence factor BrkB family protein [Thermoleophilia bacterium]